MTFDQLHHLLIHNCHMDVSNYEKYYNEQMKPGSKKFEIYKGYKAKTGTYNITDLFMIVSKKEKTEPLVILVCPTKELKCVKLNDIEVKDVITLYNLRNTVIKKQIELDKANLNLLNFKEKMWLKSEGM